MVTATPKVELEPCGRERRQTLVNLFQLYCHDFSEQWFDRPEGELDEEGRLEEYGPARYWTGASARGRWLIRADGRLAGFALLVNAHSHSGRPLDFQIAEFFVARKHRRSRVGKAAALAVIRARPGLWELAVARRNVGAQHFWRAVAADIAGDKVEELDQDDERWNGLILRFRS